MLFTLRTCCASMIRCPNPLSEPMNISATITMTSAIDTAERSPTNVGCRLSQISTSRKTCQRDAPITFAAMIRCLRALITPYALLNSTISSAPNAAIATLLISDTPKISRNSGISADDGVERKKSIRNSTLRYARSLLPSSTPSGTPMTAAIRNASIVRSRETPKSASNGPPARPVTSVTMVAHGVGNRIGLINPARTTRSQTTNRISGPTTGSIFFQSNRGVEGAAVPFCHGEAAGAGVETGAPMRAVTAEMEGSLIESPLEQHRFDHHALLEDALFGEEVVELLEIRDVARLELAVEHVRREWHLGGQRPLDRGVAFHELPRLVGLCPHQLDATCVRRDVLLRLGRIFLDELGRQAGRAAMPRRQRIAEDVVRDDAGFEHAGRAVQSADGSGRLQRIHGVDLAGGECGDMLADRQLGDRHRSGAGALEHRLRERHVLDTGPGCDFLPLQFGEGLDRAG